MPREYSAFPDLREPLPFEHLFTPLVLDARARLRRSASVTQVALLNAEAHEAWEWYLLRQLCGAGSKAALYQFQVFRSVRSAFSITTRGSRRPEDALYREFVGVSPQERLWRLFEEFPLLAQYCEVLIRNWVAVVAEFLVRVEVDRNGFEANFANGRFVGRIVALHAGLSDPHHGGRSVARLIFENGARLIYKPRSLAPEAHFSEFLEILNSSEIPHWLKAARCWQRSGYGWMEDVSNRPCDTLSEVHAFYWRAGALLALVYLARGIDMHRENLIAEGEFPVLVDLEALWHPQEQAGVECDPTAATVLRTGLLPQDHPQVRTIYGWNALSNKTGSSIPTTIWRQINKDHMMQEMVNKPYRDTFHLPVLAGVERLARDFVPDIMVGFRWIGEQVVRNHQWRRKFERWIETLRRCRRRRILRSSLWYRAVLEQLTAPASLRKSDPTSADSLHIGQSVIQFTEREWQALRQLEIPWLEQESDDRTDRQPLFTVPTKDEFAQQESAIMKALAAHAN